MSIAQLLKPVPQLTNTTMKTFSLPRLKAVESTFASHAEIKRKDTPTLPPAPKELFPSSILTPFQESIVKEDPPTRPDVYIRDTENMSVSDMGKFLKIPRAQLLELLPEGLGGELPRDMIITPSRTKHVGIMMRKASFEIVRELSGMKDSLTFSKRGWLLDGKRGVGKSAVLNFVITWARLNGFLVIYEPLAGRYARDIGDIKRSASGVYIQNEFAQNFLEATAVRNKMSFDKIPCQLNIYGKTALDGNSTEYAKRQFFHLVEKAVIEECKPPKGASEAEKLKLRLKKLAEYQEQITLPSMRERLPEPRTLWDIVDFGIQNEAFATQAVYELFQQLRVQTTFPLLVVADEVNETLPVSQYVSKRYDDTRFNGYIPGYHLCMSRLFSRFDGEKYKRGVLLHSTSWRMRNRRNFRCELLGFKPNEIKIVKEFSPDEFANYVAHYHLQDIIFNFPKDRVDYFYMLTQGNGFQARKLLATLY